MRKIIKYNNDQIDMIYEILFKCGYYFDPLFFLKMKRINSYHNPEYIYQVLKKLSSQVNFLVSSYYYRISTEKLISFLLEVPLEDTPLWMNRTNLVYEKLVAFRIKTHV